MIFARCVLQVLQDLPSGRITDQGDQPVIKRDICQFRLNCNLAGCGQRCWRFTLFRPLIGRNIEAESLQLTLDRFGMATFSINDIDEGTRWTEFVDHGRIGRFGLAFVIERVCDPCFRRSAASPWRASSGWSRSGRQGLLCSLDYAVWLDGTLCREGAPVKHSPQ